MRPRPLLVFGDHVVRVSCNAAAVHDEPAVLERQVQRMLAEPRARASLVQNFFEQWLETGNVWLLKPENTKFPWFDDNLRIAFVQEIELFLNAQLKEDRSVLDLLVSTSGP